MRTNVEVGQMVELRISKPGVKWAVKAVSDNRRRALVGSDRDTHLPIWVWAEDVIA